MDSVIQALSRARQLAEEAPGRDRQDDRAGMAVDRGPEAAIRDIEQVALDPRRLEARRIVAFDIDRPQTRAFDVVRNTVLKDLAENESQVVAVTAPTEGCGVTTTAANLAFSVARLRKGNVLLVDANPHRATLPGVLGFSNAPASNDEPAWQRSIRAVEAGGVRLFVGSVATAIEAPSADELRNALANWVKHVRPTMGPLTVILDLPPVLADDIAIPLVLDADAIVIVIAADQSKAADIEAAKSYLPSDAPVHYILNKARKFDV